MIPVLKCEIAAGSSRPQDLVKPRCHASVEVKRCEEEIQNGCKTQRRACCLVRPSRSSTKLLHCRTTLAHGVQVRCQHQTLETVPQQTSNLSRRSHPPTPC